MEYKNLRILTISSIIVGIILFIVVGFLGGTAGYYKVSCGFDPDWRRSNYIPQYEITILMYYAIGLTIVVFIVYPILNLRKANKMRLGMIK